MLGRRTLPLSLLMLAACPGGGSDGFDGTVEIFFRAQSGDQLLFCNDPNLSDDLADLRFFVHDVRLVTDDGEDVPVELVDDGAYQADGVALLDFEDASGECASTPTLNKTIRGKVDPAGAPYVGLRFRLGVPVGFDYADPASLPAPLAEPLMLAPSGGHLFLSAAGWFGGALMGVQLFATDCTGTGRISCARPNHPEISLDGFDLDESSVVIDLRELFAGGTAGGCFSRATDPLCAVVFPQLGLDLASGASIGSQRAFRLE